MLGHRPQHATRLQRHTEMKNIDLPDNLLKNTRQIVDQDVQSSMVFTQKVLHPSTKHKTQWQQQWSTDNQKSQQLSMSAIIMHIMCAGRLGHR